MASSRKGSRERLPLDRGAVDEETFMAEFELVPTKITIYSAKDVTSELTSITTILSNPNQEWDKKRELLKRLRALIMAGAGQYEEFYGNLKILELSCQMCLKDLRSQLVRETCVTIAYMSTVLGGNKTNGKKMDSKIDRFERFIEGVLQCLFDLIPNSAKIMSSSAIVCIRFLIQYTHSPRLVPLYCTNMSSKHRSTRRAVCEFMDQLLHTWDTPCLEKHMPLIQEAIKKGINDADSEARVYARKAFHGFRSHFPTQADSMASQLDGHKQKLLYDEVGGSLSTASSSSSLTSKNAYHGRQPISFHPISSRVDSGLSSMANNQYNHRPSVSSYNSIPCLPARPSSAMSSISSTLNSLRINQKGSKIPVLSPKDNGFASPSMMSPFTRYRSAIDEGAAKRARARAVIQSAMNNSNNYGGNNGHNGLNSSKQQLNWSFNKNRAAFGSNSSCMMGVGGTPSRSLPPSRGSSPPPLPPPPAPLVTVRKQQRVSTSPKDSPNNTTLIQSPLNKTLIQSPQKPLVNGSTPLSNNHQNITMVNNGSRTSNQLDTTLTPRRRNVAAGDEADVCGINGDNGDSGINCINVLKPIIGELSNSVDAIKMLTKLIEQQDEKVVKELLPEMMPGLIDAYDSSEIAVRKAAVFAMVSIHGVIGEQDMEPFLSKLSGSKKKLLTLYIEKRKKVLQVTTLISNN